MSSQDFVCRIPLKPTNEPLKEDEVRKLLTNPKFRLIDEFAVRYLESIGAAPTPANIKMVKAEIPVKRFKLKASYKSRGGLDDMIYMERSEPKSEGRHLWRGCAARSLFSEMVDKKLAATTPAHAQEIGKDMSHSLLGAGKERDSTRAGLPKLNAANIPAPNRQAPMSPSQRDDIATRVKLARLATATSQASPTERSRKGRRKQVGNPDFLDEPESDVSEVVINVAMDDVLSIQTMFTRTFPLSHIRDRLLEDDLAQMVGELTGISMAQLILNIFHLCEWAVVHKFSPPPRHHLAHPPAPDKFAIQPHTQKTAEGSPGEKAGNRKPVEFGSGKGESELSAAVEKLLTDVFEGWTDIQSRVSKRKYTIVAYPIYLMLVRVAVETILRNAVPSIFKGPRQEVLVLSKTERIISVMLDPDRYLNYPLPAPPGKAFIEGLQPPRAPPDGVPALNPAAKPWAPSSGPQAVKVHPSARFFTVSPHVKTLLAATSCHQLSHFKHAQTVHQPANLPAGGASPRDYVAAQKSDAASVAAGAAGVSGGGQDVQDFSEILSKKLSQEVLRKMYLLALKKRDSVRKKADSKKSKKAVDEDDALNSILPMGVDYLKRPTMGDPATALAS